MVVCVVLNMKDNKIIEYSLPFNKKNIKIRMEISEESTAQLLENHTVWQTFAEVEASVLQEATSKTRNKQKPKGSVTKAVW